MYFRLIVFGNIALQQPGPFGKMIAAGAAVFRSSKEKANWFSGGTTAESMRCCQVVGYCIINTEEFLFKYSDKKYKIKSRMKIYCIN